MPFKTTLNLCVCVYHSPLSHMDSVTVGRMHFKALFTPGHTVGHMIYLLNSQAVDAPPSLFSGDLVFLSGCGESLTSELNVTGDGSHLFTIKL